VDALEAERYAALLRANDGWGSTASTPVPTSRAWPDTDRTAGKGSQAKIPHIGQRSGKLSRGTIP